MAAQPLTADILKACATRLSSAAVDWREPARSHGEFDQRIADVELICAKARCGARTWLGAGRRARVRLCGRERAGDRRADAAVAAKVAQAGGRGGGCPAVLDHRLHDSPRRRHRNGGAPRCRAGHPSRLQADGHGRDPKVWQRIDGRWRLRLVHTTPVPATPPVVSLSARKGGRRTSRSGHGRSDHLAD